MCYMADGANSRPQEILGQLLYRRDEETGRLDSRVISISSISDKTAEGQRVAYKNGLTRPDGQGGPDGPVCRLKRHPMTWMDRQEGDVGAGWRQQ